MTQSCDAHPAFERNPAVLEVRIEWLYLRLIVEANSGVREHAKPIFDEFKKQGFISDYKVFTNFTSDGPNDWNIAVGVLYPSYAAMDLLDAKGATVVVKHYGSREAMFDAAKKRAEIRDVVSSKVAREVIPK